MYFVESDTECQTVPSWAEFLIRFGYCWRSADLSHRRIAVVSMPCDSAAAGLLTLGAMIRDLECPQANNLENHYDSLLRYAQQYLHNCRDCDLEPCDPLLKGCGYVRRATGRLRSVRQPRMSFEISERTCLEERQLALVRLSRPSKGMIELPNPPFALNWHIEGEPPLRPAQSDGALSQTPYSKILSDAAIVAENLSASYSGLCFAARSSGAAQSRNVCSAIVFRDETGDFNLADLLTIQGWSDWGISRVALFNTRTGRMDHGSQIPSLVVADGDGSFHAVAAKPEFQQSDIIGIIDRTIERERLEAVGSKIASLSQWYEPDDGFLSEVPEIPRGISIVVMKRR